MFAVRRETFDVGRRSLVVEARGWRFEIRDCIVASFCGGSLLRASCVGVLSRIQM